MSIPGRPLGRDTQVTMEHWPTIMASMPVAPSFARGPLPRKSPPIWRFVNPRAHHQIIGMCVGRSACRMKELLLRIPPDATESSEPLPPVDLSSLWDYWIARNFSRQRGIRLGADGAIVSHSVQASAALGACSLLLWPDDAVMESRYSDGRAPDQADIDFGVAHPIKQYAILDTFQKQLEYLSMGYAVQTGMGITEGWMGTDPEGRFANAGRTVGGHATCTVGYDLDAGWVAILNSWPQWGRRSTDPAFAETDGYTNIGYMPIEQYERQFTDSMIARGESEAVVVSSVGGFDRPLIRFDWKDVFGGVEKPA